MEPNQDANSMVDALVDALMGTGEAAAKPAAPGKTRTITLTGRRPVKVREDLWPVIAEAKDETTIPGWHLGVSYKVRQHQDGRCIAYATLEVSPEDGQTKKQRGGYLLAATDTIEPTVEQLAEDLGTGFGQGIKDWMIMCAEACIASLPAEDLDAPPVVEIDTTELFKAVVAKHSREEFEAYILTERGHAYLERMEGDDTAYKDEFVQEAWEAWSAARDGWTDVWSDEQIREFARSYGGAFHGPVIEHLSIAEAKFFELFRAVCRWDGAPESTEAVDDDELDCTLCDGEPIEDNHAED